MCQHLNSNEALAENNRPMDTSLTYYLITIIKSARKDMVYKSELDSIYDFLKYNLSTLHVLLHCYEIDDTYYQLHSHAIVSISQYFKYLHYNNLNGYFIHWKKIKEIKRDFPRVNKYLHKDAHDKFVQEHILITNYYNNNYGFV